MHLPSAEWEPRAILDHKEEEAPEASTSTMSTMVVPRARMEVGQKRSLVGPEVPAWLVVVVASTWAACACPPTH